MLMLDFESLISEVGGVAVFLIILVVAILAWVFSLKVGIGAVKGRDKEFGAVFITSIINWVVTFACSYIPLGWLIGLIVNMLIIKFRHETSFFGALGALIIAVIVVILLVILLVFLLGASLAGIFALLM